MTCLDTLYLNEHSELKIWLKLKMTSVKTLVNENYPIDSLHLINVKL